MFAEILECVLEFIGLHSEQRGCSGKELLSFVSTDVLPYYDLIDHVTLRQMVLGLLISENNKIDVKQNGKPVVLSELMGGSVPYERCTFHPTLPLQERTLGIPLRGKNIRAAVNYACNDFVAGFSRFPKRASGCGGRGDGHSATSGLRTGIRRLMREQWLRVLYVYKADTSIPEPYLFPHFAVLFPRNHAAQRLRPLEAYLERRRGELWPHHVAIDPSIARRVVMSSPERRLVLEDAIHAVLAAHGYNVPVREGRRLRFSVRKLFSCAGLRVALAFITVKQKRRRVWVVVGNRDPLALDDDGGDGEVDGDGGGETLCGDSDDGGDDDDNDDDDDDGEDDDDNDDDDDDGGSDDEDNKYGGAGTAGRSAARGDGDVLFGIDPSYPLPLQVVKAAEQHPLALESVLPRAIFYDVRGTESDLHRFARQFEERWGTIESINVLSRYSKAFTRLLQPKGWSDAGNNRIDNNGEEADETLPKGLSRWSLTTVLEALRAAPLQALPVIELARIVDRRTVGRLLPYLRAKGMVSTTGITTSNGRRIGIVTLANVEFTSEMRAALMQSYADDLSEREQKRQQSAVWLRRLPEPAEGGEGHSVTAEVMAKAAVRSARLVAKVTMVRNGYSRVGLFRVSRLHLELWRVWCSLGLAPSTPLTLERVLQEMSLSSFCIVVGVANVDVSEYIGEKASLSCTWGTSICRLPPSLQEYCRRSGVQPLLHSLSGLQSRGLVVSEQSFVAYMDLPFAEVSLSLSPTAQDEQEQCHIFYDNGTMTPQDTCYAVLSFWSRPWESVAPTQESRRTVGLIREVVLTEPNMSDLQIIALSRLLRMDSGIIAEYILQQQGSVRVRKRTICDVLQANNRQRNHQSIHGGTKRRRIEVNGATMAEAVEAALMSNNPLRALTNLGSFLKRQKKAPGLSTHSPYLSRVHGSMQTLLQSILSAVKNRGTEELSLVRNIVTSVVSPNFSVTFGGNETGVSSGTEKASASTVIADHSCEDSAHSGEPSEALQDVLRMILLSDEAHYDAVAAKALLAQFSEAEQDHCIDWLLTFPSFRGRSGGSGRLSRIELSPNLTFVPAMLAAKITHHRSPTAIFMQDITTSLLFTRQSNCRRWCVPPFAVTEDAVGKDLLRRAPRLLEQRLMNINSLAEEIREQNGLGLLRLPRFAWPPRSADLSRVSSPVDGTKMSAFFEGLPGTVSTHEMVEPYPARALLRPLRQLRHLELRDIPVDAPPSAEKVELARSAVAVPKDDLPSLRFPSIFHHVNGSFHEFVWRSFLFAVYSLVHHTPGITEDQITLQLKTSGLVSGASCRVALEFLKKSLVIVARRVVVPRDTEAGSPFGASAAACQYRECYFCTVLQGGPWNIMDL